jgi:hypothetical protein
MNCPKCGVSSGNDWSQCKGSCPIPVSPYYDKWRDDALTPEQLDEILIYERRKKQKEDKKPMSGLEPAHPVYKTGALPSASPAGDDHE